MQARHAMYSFPWNRRRRYTILRVRACPWSTGLATHPHHLGMNSCSGRRPHSAVQLGSFEFIIGSFEFLLELLDLQLGDAKGAGCWNGVPRAPRHWGSGGKCSPYQVVSPLRAASTRSNHLQEAFRRSLPLARPPDIILLQGCRLFWPIGNTRRFGGKNVVGLLDGLSRANSSGRGMITSGAVIKGGVAVHLGEIVEC